MLYKILRIFKKTFFLMKYEGIFLTINKASSRYAENGRKGLTKGLNSDYKILMFKNNKLSYSKWIHENEQIIKNIDMKSLSYQPLISIIMPTYNIAEEYLKKSIDSVLAQSYTNWELCIADDCSSSNETRQCLKFYEEKYHNVKVIYRRENGHISKASNTALSLVEGNYVTFLDHDDTLVNFALLEVVKVLNNEKNIQLIYSDEDKIDKNGRRFDPHFKSDWNPDMFFSQNYLSHLTVIKKEVIDKTEGFRVGYEGSQDYDLFLQCLDFISYENIYHIPKILYHWRAIDCSTAQNSSAKSYTTEAGIKALKDFFSEEKNIIVEKGFLENTYKVNYLITNNPLVSIIIPTKDNYELLSTAINSILNKTSYKNYEIIIVDNQTTELESLEYLEYLTHKENIKVLKYDDVFNYAKINNYAVNYASGEFLAFLNNDIEVINEMWLNEMLQHAQRKEIGIVGAKLYYADRTIQHGGVILGIGGVAGHAHKYFAEEAHGYFSRLKIIQNYSALTAACIVMKKSIFEELDGFEEELQIAFNDIDLSLKVLKKGYRNLWTPYAKLIHYESKSRGAENTLKKKKRFDKEMAYMKKKWGKEILEDKYYNKNLTLEHENFSLKVKEES